MFRGLGRGTAGKNGETIAWGGGMRGLEEDETDGGGAGGRIGMVFETVGEAVPTGY